MEEAMPTAGSERFVIPTEVEKAAFAELVARLMGGETAWAGALAAQNGYELLAYTDRGDGNAKSWILRELKPTRKGWGLYVFRAKPLNEIIIEAPHPLADEGTPSVALAMYRALHARALSIAGAHRRANADGSADAAHTTQSVFESVHEALTEAGTPIVLQIHGFASGKHPGYPQIILSHDLGVETELLDELSAALTAQGLTVGVCDGAKWQALCGETNVQSRHIADGLFIHFELDETVRSDDQRLLAALALVFKCGGACTQR
jgi:hypothetical protein